MAKSKTIFVCNQCGFESGKWNGRCQECGAWNSFEETEQTVSVRTGSARKTSDLTDKIITSYNLNDEFSSKLRKAEMQSRMKQELESLTVFSEEDL